MAEIFEKDGTWAFDGGAIRIVPGRERGVHLLRQTLGEVIVPLAAVAGASFEPGRKGGRLRLRLRDGADPLLQAARGQLPDGADPYQLAIDPAHAGVAEYFVDEVRTALVLEQVPDGPSDRYLLPGPAVPLSVTAGDGTVAFDGERISLEWNWKTEDDKKSAGRQSLPLAEVGSVEWQPSIGLENGYLRFLHPGQTARTPPKYDPHAIEFYGFKKDPLLALVAAAVTARLPHPSAPVSAAPAALAKGGTEPAADHDALLRRLRELGELHQAGVLTDEEFAAAKQAVIKRF
ncbi:Tat pathway signal sequence domain protein [Streptomyces griseocarneus]|nr:Tat pathway signal sequence domain protein [Streptomyces griseocarneus]